MARVKLIQEKSDLPSQYHDVFNELAALRGRISGPSSVVLHSIDLAHPWNGISEFLHRKSIVEPEYAELAVCTSARAWDCAYVWAAHVPAALQAGVSQGAIDAIAAFRDRHPNGDTLVVAGGVAARPAVALSASMQAVTPSARPSCRVRISAAAAHSASPTSTAIEQ